MQRVCARWVPRLLKEEEKQRRVLCSREFLRRVRSGRENFFDRIITTDETWLHYYDPEGKRASSVWKTPGTPPPKKDNAPSHTAEQTKLELDLLGFSRISHPPYSPDLAPMDFALFPYLKAELRGQRFSDLEELKQET
nr:histone-lysine N-methyltransferase SETMAR-like [Crassostrea gigas]